MAKSERDIRPFENSETQRRFEKRQDFTEQGITIKWSWIRQFIDFLIQAKEKRKLRHASNKKRK